MNKHLLILIAAVCLAWTAAPGLSADPATTPSVRLTLELSDGSRVVGAPSIDRLNITTAYASLDIQLSMLRAIEFSDTGRVAHVNFTNGDVLNGQLAATHIAMSTIFGQVVIPISIVRKIRVGSTGGPMPDGLVLHYTFARDEGALVTDTSGSGNDGTVQGAAFSKEGRQAGAMKFNGDGDAILLKNTASLQLQNFTIAAWIKRDSKEKVSEKVTIGDNALLFGYGQGGYGLCLKSDNTLAISNVGIDHVHSSFEIRDDGFHHVAVTKKGSKVVFYLDGVADPAPDYDTNFSFSTEPALGIRADANSNGWLGMIGELEVFNRALSDDEVKQIYDSQK